MKLNEYKTVKISPELHKELKIYCDSNNYKLNGWIEGELKKVINEVNEKKNK
jgi:predicted HicB family RNase H-like nuclease